MSAVRQEPDTAADVARPSGGAVGDSTLASPPKHMPPLQIAPPLPPLTRGELVAIAVAAALHLALFAALVAERVEHVGGDGSLIEVVSVDFVEVAAGKRVTAGDGSHIQHERRAPKEGLTEASPEASAANAGNPSAAESSSEPPPASLAEKDEPQAEAPRDIVSPRVGEGVAKEGERTAEHKTAEAAQDAAAASNSPPPAEIGGGLRGTNVIELPGSVAATASGAAREYAKAVLEVLSRNRPKVEPGSIGKVHFAFAVSLEGYTTAVRLTRSSGNARLDAAALAAIRDLRFPRPPAGLRAADLNYETYFDFRPEKPA
jgi:protein TonB